MQAIPEHSAYYYEMKARYEGTASEQILPILSNEMSPHIETLQTSAHHIQCLVSSSARKFPGEYDPLVNGLVKRIEQIEELRAEALADSDLPSVEKLSLLHYIIDMPLAYICGCAELFLKVASDKSGLDLPEEYERWVTDMREAANRIWDLLEVFTGVRLQD
jgi:hypothetical protein